MIRVALLQITSSDQPAENLANLERMIDDAAGQGAVFVLTPEVSNCVSTSRAHQNEVLTLEEDDVVLNGLSAKAAQHGIHILAGSVAVKTDDPDGRFANRSVLFGPDGQAVARYDKVHMFDVTVSETETYKESAGYRPGDHATLADTALGKIGLTICYDVRFPYLYRDLAQAGAQIIAVPSAFSPVTGAAHWHTLLQARAIETGCFILAPAQTGTHAASSGKPRKTYGHSLVVSPWGEVLADAGVDVGATVVDIDLADVDDARRRIPSLTHDREYRAP